MSVFFLIFLTDCEADIFSDACLALRLSLHKMDKAGKSHGVFDLGGLQNFDFIDGQI